MKILAIDDETQILELLKYNLGRLDGHQVVTATNGEEGLAQAAAGRVDLVLLDIAMPGLDGLEVCRRLKAGRKTRNLPVFMLTARAQVADVEKAVAAGADDYITKPFEPAALQGEILYKLDRWRARAKAR